MRLPWFSQRYSQRGATRRKRTAPLKVRRLERRRVLDAAVTDLVFTAADLDPSTAVQDSGEGTPITVSANATGTGTLVYDWTLSQNGSTIEQGHNPTFSYTPRDNGNYSLSLTVTDQGGEGTAATRTEDIVVRNVAPTLVVPLSQTVNEGVLNLSGIGGPPLGLYTDLGVLDTHMASVNWGDGSAVETPTIFAVPGAGTGSIGGTHTYTQEGQYTITVSVVDDDGGTASKSFTVTVVNVAPTATLSNNGLVQEGSTATVTFTNQFDPNPADTAAGFRYAYDFDNDGTFEVGDGTYAGSVADASQIIPASNFAEGPGMHTVRARIVDKDGGVTDYTTTFTIENVPPVLIVATNQTVNEGTLLDLSAVSGPPLGLLVDDGVEDSHTAVVDWGDGSGFRTATVFGAPGSGAIGGTHTYVDDGIYTVTVRVADDDMTGNFATGVAGVDFVERKFTVTVNNVPPVLIVATNQITNEGALLDLSAVTGPPLGLFVDVGLADTHTAAVNWGDGSGFQAATIFAAPGSGAIGGTHTYVDNGLYTVTVRLADDDMSGNFETGVAGIDFVERTFTVTVDNVAPTINTLTITSPINEGQSATLTGSYSDPGVLDTHLLDIDWDGDNVVDQTVAVSGGEFSVSRLFPDDDPSNTTSDTFNVNITLRDNFGDFDTDVQALTVNNIPPVLVVAVNQEVDEGALLDLSGIGGPPLGLFVDLGVEDTHTAVVNWGDGGGFESTTIFAAPGSGAIGGTHVYGDNGTYTVTVRLADDDMTGNFATGVAGVDFVERTFTVTVNNVAPTIDTLAITTPINEGQSATLTGTYSDPGFLDTHQLDVDWDGDGVVDQTIDVSGGSFSVSRLYPDDNPTNTTFDIYTVHVVLRDDDGAEATDDVSLRVNNVPPVLVVAVDQTINEGAVLDLSAVTGPPLGLFVDLGLEDTHTAVVRWGDGGDFESAAIFAAPGSGAIGGTHIYADDGTYMVTVRLADDDMTGNFGTGVAGIDFVERTFTVTVMNVAPTFDDVATSPTSINEGQTVTFTANFRDPGFDNPNNPGSEKEESFTYDVDWGDGRNPVSGQVIIDQNGGPNVDSTGSFLGSHIYADDGTYEVKITVRDDDGGFAVHTFTVVVTNVPPALTGNTGLQVDEGELTSLGELGVGLTDPGFDNPNNPTMPPLGNQFTEEFAAYTVDWGDGSAPDKLEIDMRTSDQADGPTTATLQHLNEILNRMDHVYADNGVYTVTIRVADDNMAAFSNPALFADDTRAGIDFVDLTFTITVNNVLPTLTLPNGSLGGENQPTIFESDTVSLSDLGVITDPGFSSSLPAPNNSVELFRYFVDWNDDTTFTSASSGDATIDDNGGEIVNNVVDLTDASFTGSHIYADNGIYTVRVRVADDDMGAYSNPALFRTGVAGTDYVEMTFTIVVTNVQPAFTPFPNGQNLTAPDINQDGITTVFVAYNDPGYDNPLNAVDSIPDNKDELVETFNHVIQWGDGMVDAVHQYTTVGTFDVTITVTGPNGIPAVFEFDGISSLNPVVNLVGSQQINDPSVVPELYAYQVNWGDGHVETFQLNLLNPGIPAGFTGLTNLVSSARTSGNATTNTTGLAAIQHQYLGPPNPLNPTADVIITLSVYDDDGGFVTDTIAVGNPGIEQAPPIVESTVDVPRLDLTTQPVTVGFVADQGGLAQLFQVPDIRGGGGETAATTERFLELRIVYPDGTESEGFVIKDEALDDLREFFKTLPDGRYRIYLVRTENRSDPRLVIEVDVRRGRVIDVTDDSEGNRDRPPTEEETPAAVPLEQNPLLEQREGQGDTEIQKHGEVAETAGQVDDRVSLSPVLPYSLSLAALVAAEPWSRRVDDALARADEGSWQRLRRAGRRGRWAAVPKLAIRPWMLNFAPLY